MAANSKRISYISLPGPSLQQGMPVGFCPYISSCKTGAIRTNSALAIVGAATGGHNAP